MHIINGLNIYWTNIDKAQIGIDARVGARLDSLIPAEIELVDALTKPHTEQEYFAHAQHLNIPPSRAKRLLAMLNTAGYLATEEPQLPDAEVNARIHQTPPSRRTSAHIHIPRLDPLGVGIAIALAASGISTISTADEGPVTARDHPILATTMIGMPKIHALTHILRRINPVVHLNSPALPDLAVVTGSHAIDPYYCGAFTSKGIPTLNAWVEEIDVYIGPLTLPHETPCASCVYYYRLEQNPDWAILAPQLFAAAAIPPAVATRDLAIAIAAREIVAEIDGLHSPLRNHICLIPPAPEPPKLRPIAAHPRCGCIEIAPHATEIESQASHYLIAR